VNTAPGRFVGVMLMASPGHYPDMAVERAQAREIFGTPRDTRTWFTEPHGFWWGVLDIFFPAANPLCVWLYDEEWH